MAGCHQRIFQNQSVQQTQEFKKTLFLKENSNRVTNMKQKNQIETSSFPVLKAPVKNSQAKDGFNVLCISTV